MTPDYIDVEQGSDEWVRLRIGVPTASEFGKVVGCRTRVEQRARDTYMRKLAGEILTERPTASVDIENFRRGHANEPRAAALYAVLTDDPVETVGFVRNGRLGASPDRLVGSEGLLEIKDAAPHVQIARLETGGVPAEYEWQVHGQLLVCSDRRWVDFVSHCEGLPPLIVRVERDSYRLAELKIDLEQFVSELDDLVRRIREM